jgi:hypothetical protein
MINAGVAAKRGSMNVEDELPKSTTTPHVLYIFENIIDNMAEYNKWFSVAQYILPPKMSVSEARALFDRKLFEEEQIRKEGCLKHE